VTVNAIDEIHDLLDAMPWWSVVALIILSRGPGWLREWALAIRELRAPGALGPHRRTSKFMP